MPEQAKVHLLILPRKMRDGLSVLSKDDTPMLDAMRQKAEQTVKEMKTKDPSLKFRVGFHAVPSMRQLHLHVISQDFQSDHLKVKKHWNSFTTEFFRDFDEVRRLLAETGKVAVSTT